MKALDELVHRELIDEPYFQEVRLPYAANRCTERIMAALQFFFPHNPLKKMEGTGDAKGPSQTWTRIKQVVELALKLKLDLIFQPCQFHLRYVHPGMQFNDALMADASHKTGEVTQKTVQMCLSPAFYLVPGDKDDFRPLTQNFVCGDVNVSKFQLISKAQVLLND